MGTSDAKTPENSLSHFRQFCSGTRVVAMSEFPKPYEVFEHTADVGLHAYGRTPAELFIHAAQGMQGLLVAPEQVHRVINREIHVTGHDLTSLLIAWLNELIFLFDTEYLLFSSFEIASISTTNLVGRAYGEPYDRTRHELGSAIKAATWHGADIHERAAGYPYDSSRGKAAPQGDTEKIEHLL